MPTVVNSDFEVKNQSSSQGLVSARSAEVKLSTLYLPIFSGVTEEWLAFSDLFEAAGAVNVLNSSELSVDAPVFSPAPILGTCEPSKKSRVVDVRSCISDVNPDVQTLLCTALIQVRDIWGNYQTCRCLLDSGSQASLITNECIERLGLRKEKANVRISCLGASDTRTNGLAEIQFTSCFSSQNSFHASVYVINKIVGKIPHHDLDSSMRELFGDISLADPAFYKSGPIDVLLGVDLTLQLLKGQTLSLGKDKPFAIRSELGWIICGKANYNGQNSLDVNHIQLVSDQLINKFCELDSVPCAKPLTSLEEACEDHFVRTHSRDENGRYTVRLPFHTPPTRLGNSKQNAIRRLISVKRHLISNPDKYNLYRNFMKEYLDLMHIELIPDSEINNVKSLYLPHHGVVKDTSCTTKSLTPPVKLFQDYLSTICSWLAQECSQDFSLFLSSFEFPV
ncbi:integrase catalytic domain-containing protein [Trichonephila inaurata madagascariensis]|uniref:Integrase catalytic domain-containing protein n=1 Tax=Trichonephila inaurata madagascariensis TaxID=2747483 RepID=A0A8X6YKZ3_9ARAC|nr:integrase catalytic domain-containing protein [Trichonephila inaurata madagascariensis]